MRAELPTACDIGLKRNAKGFTSSWIGYKLHLDVCEAGIPVAAILTSASTHDSQRCYGASGEKTASSSLQQNRRGAPCHSRMT